jgi:opacity protein-like surface antigen
MPGNWVEKIKVSLGQRAGLSLMLLAAATIGLAATQALAADLPRKAPVYVPPAPPPICWTGCYIGANIDGAFGDASATFPGGEISSNGSGFAGGGQIGCDYQFARHRMGNWLPRHV